MEKTNWNDSKMHVCLLMHGDATMGLMAVGVMNAVGRRVLRKKQCPYAVLFMLMELLPGETVAGGA